MQQTRRLLTSGREWVQAIHQDGWRTDEPKPLGILWGRHNKALDPLATAADLLQRGPQTLLDDCPVRTTVEVDNSYVHVRILRPEPLRRNGCSTVGSVHASGTTHDSAI